MDTHISEEHLWSGSKWDMHVVRLHRQVVRKMATQIHWRREIKHQSSKNVSGTCGNHTQNCLIEDNILHTEHTGKGKAHPRTGHEGTEGEETYSSTLPSTSALDGGGWSMPCPGRFTPRKDLVPIV
jgi:hypothetical protein